MSYYRKVAFGAGVSLRALAFAIAGSAVLIAGPGGAPTASAQTSLQDALAQAYRNSPTLEAKRAELRGIDESVPQALSNWRPTVTMNTTIGRANVSPLNEQPTKSRVEQDLYQFNGNIQVAQPIFRGFRTQAQTALAEAQVRAGRADLASTEQKVLLDAITAFLDVIQNQSVVDLNKNNEQVLRKQLEATQDRFRVGEVTRTDVSQAESRLSRATSDRITSEGLLNSSRAVYQRIMGEMPGRLAEPAVPAVAASIDEALKSAREENPDLLATVHREVAAREDIDVSFGALLPTVSLTGLAQRAVDALAQETVNNTLQGGLTLSMPIYEAGNTYSLVRQKKQVASQRRVQIDETRRLIDQSATQAWENMVASRATITSREDQVKAAQVALDGVQQEAQVGSRTTLDVLNAEQELLDARVNLVKAQRDFRVASYNLNSAMGRLTARSLNLPVEQYDPAANYQEVRGKWIGTGPSGK